MAGKFMLRSIRVGVVGFCLLLLPLQAQNCAGQDDKLETAINAVAQVGTRGQGHEQAVKHIDILNRLPIQELPKLLEGINRANNKLAVNWFRSSVVSIVARGGELPVASIEDYFNNQDNSQLGRLLAFDLLAENDPSWAKATIPTMLDDSSMPLREKAVAHWIEQAKQADENNSGAEVSLGYLTKALTKARDVEQVQTIVKLLKQRGVEISLQQQLGILPTWQLVGVFDNKDESGFDVAYGPEKTPGKIDTTADYEDMNGESTQWKKHTTPDPTGMVDLNEAVGKVKGATVYAYTTFDAEEDRSAEIRIGSSNAHKVWVNGELVISNEIYHNGVSADKFSGKINLIKGDNQILVKVCQNEMTQPWAQRWDLIVRICDQTGKAIQPATPAAPQM